MAVVVVVVVVIVIVVVRPVVMVAALIVVVMVAVAGELEQDEADPGGDQDAPDDRVLRVLESLNGTAARSR